MMDRAFDNKQFILCGNDFSSESVNIRCFIDEARNRLEEVMYENHVKLLKKEILQKLKSDLIEEFDESCYDVQMKLYKFNTPFNQFIKSNLIINVRKWIFEQAVKDVKCIRVLFADFKLNFNISFNQIKDDTFVKSMEEFLKKSGVNADELIMELTETQWKVWKRKRHLSSLLIWITG